MKTMKLLFVIMLVASFGMNATGQTTTKSGKSKTESLKVLGNCSMCKDRIEKAATLEGVEKASWDSKTDLLTLTYDPTKTNPDVVAKKVASVGHDAGKFNAEEKVYNALPACCKYDRTGEKAEDHTGHTH